MAYLSTMTILLITIAWQMGFVATVSNDDHRVPSLTCLTQPADYADIHVGTEVTFTCFVNESVNHSFPITWKKLESGSNFGGSERIYSNNFTVSRTMRDVDNYKKFKCSIGTDDHSAEDCEVTPLQLPPYPDIQGERNEYSVGENATFYCRPRVNYPAVTNYTWSVSDICGRVHDIRSSGLTFDIRDEGSTLVIINVSIAEKGTKFACTATNSLGIRANSSSLSPIIRSNNSTDVWPLSPSMHSYSSMPSYPSMPSPSIPSNNYNIIVYVMVAITVTLLVIVTVLLAYFLKRKTRRESQHGNTRATSSESERGDIEFATISGTAVDVNVSATIIHPFARELSLVYAIPNTDPTPLFNLTMDNYVMYQNTARPGSYMSMFPTKSNTLPRVLSTTRRSFKVNTDRTQRYSTDYVVPELCTTEFRVSAASYEYPDVRVSNARGIFKAYSINF